MSVRVDYRCQRCGLLEELAVDTPGATRSCSACGGTTKRQWTTFGFGPARSGDGTDRAGAGTTLATTAVRQDPTAELCRSNTGVPGLCLLSESAGRALVARTSNDGRALEREQQRQTDVLATTGKPGVVVSDHGHGHSQGGGHGSIVDQRAGRGPREIS